MKKYTIFLLFILFSFAANAQTGRKYFLHDKKPTGVVLGASIGNDTQLRLSTYAYNFYVAYSSNFTSIGPGVPTGIDSSLENTGKKSVFNMNIGYMIRLRNTFSYGLYLVPQFVYETTADLYKVRGAENSPYIKGESEINYGFGADLMFVDVSGFTVSVGGSSTSGVNLGLGFSF